MATTASTPSRPFTQGRFHDLPEAPRVPHAYERTEAHDLEMESGPFGRIRIHYRTLGPTGESTADAPPLLLVHGLMTSSYSWRYVVEPLAERFRVIAPDLPGSGRSGCPDVSYGPDRIADWIGELQRELGIAGCAAIGNSMGGYLCMRLALRDPGAFSRLVNLHSPGTPTARMWLLHGALSIPGAGGLLGRLVGRDVERWTHRNVHYHDESLKSLEEARVYAEPLSTREGVRAFERILHETLDPREMGAFVRELAARRDDGRGFPVPLQLQYAERDPMVPRAVGERLRALVPDAEFVSLERASHFAHVDAPERFLPPALRFLGA